MNEGAAGTDPPPFLTETKTMKIYTFKRPVLTDGKSGTRYRIAKGESVTAKDDEFDHLNKGLYAAEKAKAEKKTEKARAEKKTEK